MANGSVNPKVTPAGQDLEQDERLSMAASYIERSMGRVRLCMAVLESPEFVRAVEIHDIRKSLIEMLDIDVHNDLDVAREIFQVWKGHEGTSIDKAAPDLASFSRDFSAQRLWDKVSTDLHSITKLLECLPWSTVRGEETRAELRQTSLLLQEAAAVLEKTLEREGERYTEENAALGAGEVAHG